MKKTISLFLLLFTLLFLGEKTVNAKIYSDLSFTYIDLEDGGYYNGFNVQKNLLFTFAHSNMVDGLDDSAVYIQVTLPSMLTWPNTPPSAFPSSEWSYTIVGQTLTMINLTPLPPNMSPDLSNPTGYYLGVDIPLVFNIIAPTTVIGNVITMQTNYTPPPLGAGIMKYGQVNPELGREYGISVQNNPLAITLGHFAAKAKGCETELVWTTLSETNNSYFAVERSRDGKNFEVIGKVESKVNNSTEAVSYHYTDNAPLKGQNFYRLTQYDFDGKSTSSAIEKVNISCQALDVSLFPNPTKGVVYIKGIQDASTIKVFNVLGQEVLSQASDKLGTSIIDISTLAVGSYTVKILQNEEVVFTSKIVKQD